VVAYGKLLQQFYGLHGALEASFRQHTVTSGLMLERSKLAWLTADLNTICPDWERTYGAPPIAWEPPFEHFAQPAQALGAFYVAEGSTLGGKIIAQRLSVHSWLEPARHLNFFYSYGHQRGDNWRQVIQVLNEYAENNPSDTPLMVAGAHRTFQLFEQALLSHVEDEVLA